MSRCVGGPPGAAGVPVTACGPPGVAGAVGADADRIGAAPALAAGDASALAGRSRRSPAAGPGRAGAVPAVPTGLEPAVGPAGTPACPSGRGPDSPSPLRAGALTAGATAGADGPPPATGLEGAAAWAAAGPRESLPVPGCFIIDLIRSTMAGSRLAKALTLTSRPSF